MERRRRGNDALMLLMLLLLDYVEGAPSVACELSRALRKKRRSKRTCTSLCEDEGSCEDCFTEHRFARVTTQPAFPLDVYLTFHYPAAA